MGDISNICKYRQTFFLMLEKDWTHSGWFQRAYQTPLGGKGIEFGMMQEEL